MLSRRQLVKRLAASSSAVVLSAFPWKLQLGSLTIAHDAQRALAQGKGAGNGNGNGNGSGSGNGSNNGGGNGGGNGNGNGAGKGGGNSGGNSGNAGRGKSNGKGKGSGKPTSAAPADAGPDGLNSPSVDVHHADGIQETIRNGRYIMRDRQGRVIIDRKATIKDRFRLHSFLN